MKRPITQMANLPPGRISRAMPAPTSRRSATQFSAPKFEIAPSNSPSSRAQLLDGQSNPPRRRAPAQPRPSPGVSIAEHVDAAAPRDAAASSPGPAAEIQHASNPRETDRRSRARPALAAPALGRIRSIARRTRCELRQTAVVMLRPPRTSPASPCAQPRCGAAARLRNCPQQLVRELKISAAVPAANLHVAIRGPYSSSPMRTSLSRHLLVVRRALDRIRHRGEEHIRAAALDVLDTVASMSVELSRLRSPTSETCRSECRAPWPAPTASLHLLDRARRAPSRPAPLATRSPSRSTRGSSPSPPARPPSCAFNRSARVMHSNGIADAAPLHLRRVLAKSSRDEW